MTLMLKLTRDMAKFEVSDDDAETVVAITVNDDQDALLRKLKRVIALVEGEQAALPPAVPEYGVMRSEAPMKYVDASPVPPQTGNGWAAVYGPPALPERLEGEVELVQPGEGT